MEASDGVQRRTRETVVESVNSMWMVGSEEGLEPLIRLITPSLGLVRPEDLRVQEPKLRVGSYGLSKQGCLSQGGPSGGSIHTEPPLWRMKKTSAPHSGHVVGRVKSGSRHSRVTPDQ